MKLLRIERTGDIVTRYLSDCDMRPDMVKEKNHQRFVAQMEPLKISVFAKLDPDEARTVFGQNRRKSLDSNGCLAEFSYLFHEGYVTDLASVPSIFKSIVDDNDPSIVEGALVHDFNYLSECLESSLGNTREGWKLANNMLKEMAIHSGMSWPKSILVWLAVSTPIGWNYYKKSTEFDMVNRRFCSFSKKIIGKSN